MKNKEAREHADDILMELEEGSYVFNSSIRDLRRSRGFWNILEKLPPVSQTMVRAIEELAKEITNGLTGKEKKHIALEGVMMLLPELPWWTKFIPIRMILGRAIDAAVEYWNEKIGQKWPKFKV